MQVTERTQKIMDEIEDFQNKIKNTREQDKNFFMLVDEIPMSPVNPLVILSNIDLRQQWFDRILYLQRQLLTLIDDHNFHYELEIIDKRGTFVERSKKLSRLALGGIF